ncbi:hypothetical protein Bhyg_12542 [Pseudolycoriella hygida]|uniref:Uncharacterized protein n=1 Tax=Pseudolycoriella hygida TaxID=35572 RepID=A0A9Q0RZE6_9DIPT|nr:hypothetical protein Bhyg_12542 [Pseudolycoriella hygida]
MDFRNEHNYAVSPESSYGPARKKIKRASICPETESDLSAYVQNNDVGTVDDVVDFQLYEPVEVNVISENVLVELESLRKQNKELLTVSKSKEAQIMKENKQILRSADQPEELQCSNISSRLSEAT